MIKQLPNIFTLLNLFFGCIAIVYILQSGLMPVYKQTEQGFIVADVNDFGNQYVAIPEQIIKASLFIGLAAIVDFFDGFVARLLKSSSELGKQLDSLADVVSFGVAPAIIVYQFLRLSYAQQEDGLNVNTLWLLPAFIIPCAGAYRLARFNIDASQSSVFKGVPIPAAGLMLASLPLSYWFTHSVWQIRLLQNKWFWYAVILVVSYLMVSTLPMLALKFKRLNLQSLLPFIVIAVIGIVAIIFLQWFAVPVIFAAYVIVSIIMLKTKPNKPNA